ncbi:TOBE domain-containing protein [Brevibacillus agri]|uniref:TOBE domain-containing protein n=1 Tax=Brevibacillus agri TaxID=51101 RepID=UPI0004725333|nr:TOBE domain-containing protein [Brevibacillus agri]
MLASFLSIAFLAGCGQAPQSQANTQGATGSQASEQKSAGGAITVYTALEDDQIKTYLESFKAKYPDVQVNIVRDSTGIITAKLLAEKDNPQADVVWGTAVTSLLVLEQQGMLEGYSPKGIERVSPAFKDTKEPASWVMVTHDQEEALTMADKIVVMNHGEVVQVGAPEEVYNKPANPFVADFIGAINFFHPSRFAWQQTDSERLLAIRPEHVRLLPHESACALPAVISELEFRGSFYRLFLECQEAGQADSELLTLDLLATEARKLGLSRGQNVWLKFPPENLLAFEQEHAAPGQGGAG